MKWPLWSLRVFDVKTVLFKNSFSFWLLVAAVSLFLLQAFPFTGIFLMFIGAGFLNAWLIYIFLGVLFVESVSGRLPKILAIIPLIAVGTYYWAIYEQHRILAAETLELQTINIGKVFDFDPDSESLVFDDSLVTQASITISNYKIPVAYTIIHTFRLVPAAACANIKSLDNRAWASVSQRRNSFTPFGLTDVKAAPCMIDTPGVKPPKKAVHIRHGDHASAKMRVLGISEPSTDVVVDDKIVGSLQKIVVHRIQPYLRFVGCGLIDNPPAWKCTTSFFEERDEVISPDPRFAINDERSDSPAGILLGLSKYTADDIERFAGYPANEAIVALAQTPWPAQAPARHHRDPAVSQDHAADPADPEPKMR